MKYAEQHSAAMLAAYSAAERTLPGGGQQLALAVEAAFAAFARALAPQEFTPEEIDDLARHNRGYAMSFARCHCDWWPDKQIYVFSTPLAHGGCSELSTLGKVIRGSLPPWASPPSALQLTAPAPRSAPPAPRKVGTLMDIL